MDEKAAGRSRPRGGANRVRAAAAVSVSVRDRELLGLVCDLRVVSQGQLERLFPEMPARTLRYRTRRLYELGLLGRSRPYRERGSAPWHFWPTRHADALMRGTPAPRGGERREPNPLFLAHAAAVSGLYVALCAGPPERVALDGFWRETPEAFRDVGGRERAIRPDAMIALRDGEDRLLLGLVEVDLGTMSHARLRAKAQGYAAYVAQSAWRRAHDWCPALLFATTSDERGRAFCRLLDRELPKRSDSSEDGMLVAAASGRAHDLAAAVHDFCWRDLTGTEGLTLLDCLRLARQPYEQRLTRERTQRRVEDAERLRLRSDPAALRTHLRQRATTPRYLLVDRFDEPTAQALELLLHGDGSPNGPERTALDALAGDDPLQARIGDVPIDETVGPALAALAAHYGHAQQTRVEELTARYGEGPALRGARARLAEKALLSRSALGDLERRAVRDQQAYRRQAEHREAYAGRREGEARRLARMDGLSARLLRVDGFLPKADRLWLRVCPDCREIAYPNTEEQAGDGDVATGRACLFCGRRDLETWTLGAVQTDPVDGSSGDHA